MRFSYAVVAALMTAVASSQSISSLVGQLPSCALTCLATAAAGAHCGLSDYACQCGPAKDVITKSATPCVTSSCSGEDAVKVLAVSNQICQALGTGTSSSTVAAAPVGSVVPSPVGSGGTPSNIPATASATTSGPAHVTANAGSKVQAGAVVAGAAVLAAFAL